MHRIRSACFGALVVVAVPAWAQWHEYPEKGIPRAADGSLNVDAPARRLPDGKPDLSGLWKVPSIQEYGWDIGKRLEGGTPLQPWARKLVDERVAKGLIDDPSSFCLPSGLIGQHLFSLHRIVTLPDRIIILFELNTTFRQIFMDGRPLPKDPLPSYMGFSVGHWEGDTLVVESSGFNGKSWIDTEGRPITEKLRLTERFRRLSFGRLEHEMTFDDPGAYTKPWTVTVPFNYVPDSELMESYCEDNQFVKQIEDAGLKDQVAITRSEQKQELVEPEPDETLWQKFKRFFARLFN